MARTARSPAIAKITRPAIISTAPVTALPASREKSVKSSATMERTVKIAVNVASVKTGPRAHPKLANASAPLVGKESGVIDRVIRIVMARTVPKVATVRMAEFVIRSMASVHALQVGAEKSANKNVSLADLDKIVRRAVIATWKIRWLVTPQPGSVSARLTGAVFAARVAVRWDCTERAVPRFAHVTTIRLAIQSLGNASALGAGPDRIVMSPVRTDSLVMAARNVAQGRCTVIPLAIT